MTMDHYETVGMWSMSDTAADLAQAAYPTLERREPRRTNGNGASSNPQSSSVPLNKAEIDLKYTLKTLWDSIEQNPDQRYFRTDLMRFLYLSTVPKGRLRSGAELGEIVFSGIDPAYGHPNAEKSFLERN